jgi:methylated-DNA-[protein]-cysteine S-methyltransferase
METLYTIMPSQLGDIFIVRNQLGITDISFQDGRSALSPHPEWQQNDFAFADVIGQLNAYFNGELQEFDLPLAPAGTDFQLEVWRRLQEIPYGQTTTYGDIAHELGNPQASRAVGAANGRNPIPIIIPCHRVIGHNGRLIGFRGGLEFKEALLGLERNGRLLLAKQLALF